MILSTQKKIIQGNREMKITKIYDFFLFPPGDSNSHDDHQNQQGDNDGHNKT